MRHIFGNCRILGPQGWIEDHCIRIVDGYINAIIHQDAASLEDEFQDFGGLSILPGFIDTQVNGGGGYLFNDNPSVETIAAIGTAHHRFGTTGFLPTLISDELEKIDAAITAVDQAIEARIPGVLGIHIEGPFLSTDRKGVHDPLKFRALTESHLELLCSLKNGVTLVTLSPEQASPTLIRSLSERGVTVCAGHTNATYAQMRAALDSGVRGFTHLFNAMSPLTSREPGVVGAALEDPHSWCGLIVDGHHVAPTTLKIAFKCKPHAKFMLVTDAMPCVGTMQRHFMFQGRKIQIADGACRALDGTLAGSNLDMANAIRNAVKTLGLPEINAIQMASANPASFLGLQTEIGTLAPGHKANFVIVDNDMNVLGTWINGIEVYANSDLPL